MELETVVTIRMEEEQLMKLQMLAKHEGMNTSEAVREAIVMWLSMHRLGG